MKLAEVELLNKLIQRAATAKIDIKPFMDDVVSILKATLADNFDELKKVLVSSIIQLPLPY